MNEGNDRLLLTLPSIIPTTSLGTGVYGYVMYLFFLLFEALLYSPLVTSCPLSPFLGLVSFSLLTSHKGVKEEG